MAAASPIKGNSGFQESPAQRPLVGMHPRQTLKRDRPLSLDKSSPPSSPPRKTRSSTAEFRKLCEDVGFQEDFPEEISLLPEEIRGHRTDEAWILRVMQEKYDDSLSEDDLSIVSLTADSLAAIGFRPSKIVEILDRIPEQFRPRQTTIYWAERIVSDDLSHLQNECPKYPFPHVNQFTRWPQQDQSSVPKGLQYVNLPDKFSRGSMSVGNHIKKLPGFPQAGPGEKILYHVTSHQSAREIVKKGIKLSVGKKDLDFSDSYGFYLAPEVDSCYTLMFTRTVGARAILVYKVDDNAQGGFTSNMLDLTENDDLWKEVVTCFRRGESQKVETLHETPFGMGLNKPFKDYDVVYGPWVQNVSDIVRRNAEPIPSEDQLQYLVQNETLAKRLHQSLKCVFFEPK
ncbi:uncharacterized protein LOC144906983 [Branchiostoma floridae x Branchiostoma belcheri]